MGLYGTSIGFDSDVKDGMSELLFDTTPVSPIADTITPRVDVTTVPYGNNYNNEVNYYCFKWNFK